MAKEKDMRKRGQRKEVRKEEKEEGDDGGELE